MIIFAVALSVVSGLIVSQVLIIGATLWVLIGLFFVLTLGVYYNMKIAKVLGQIEKLKNNSK